MFFDEFDSIAKANDESNKAGSRLINILAEAMDGFLGGSNTLYIAATNDVKIAEKLRRAGRFSRIEEFTVPGRDDIKEILEIHVNKRKAQANVPIFNDIDLDRVTDMLYARSMDVQRNNPQRGVVGADVMEVVRRTHEIKYFDYLDSGTFDPATTADFEKIIREYELTVRG